MKKKSVNLVVSLKKKIIEQFYKGEITAAKLASQQCGGRSKYFLRY